MIIDGTGDDYAKIADNKSRLEEIGYDCYMVFINTSMEIALHRNNTRKRVLPKKISHRFLARMSKKYWKISRIV